MRFLLYEDAQAASLNPLTLLRPAFELLCGRESLRRRLQRWFPSARFGVQIRPWLQSVFQEEHPEMSVNDLSWLQQEPTLVVNGRWLPGHRILQTDLRSDKAAFVGGELAWIFLEPDESALLDDENFDTALLQLAGLRNAEQTSGVIARYPWDIVSRNAQQLIFDFVDEGISEIPQAPHVVVLGDPCDVYVSPQAILDPYVVLDCRTGPISVDRDVHVQSFTRIEGPAHIGRGSKIFRALIRSGTTIGPWCRAGGEIEESILHGFVNKYHEGFVGHSYLCPWVNLGAMTCTSDLKNDYGSVRVPVAGAMIESELTKVGSFIGDHTRTAMDSMFNTGSAIGIMAMVLPGGRLLPRYVPSFCNINFGELTADRVLEESIRTAKIVMHRRDQVMTPAMEQLLRTVYCQTEGERLAALHRVSEKRRPANDYSASSNVNSANDRVIVYHRDDQLPDLAAQDALQDRGIWPFSE